MVPSLLLTTVLATLAYAAPHDQRAAAPSVTIKNGTVVGATSNGIDSFLGIPYAQPPVGDLRLRPARSVNQSFGTLQATSTPKSCPQFLQQINSANLIGDALTFLLQLPIVQAADNTDEDCLTMSVWRPAGIDETANLPVVFWIFGGGFELGATNMYDGASIVERSVNLSALIIFVEVNYRVGGFGFLPGKELTAEGSTNLGLRDQRLGLHWTADNIKAFGGDPSKVTIWGESAGSISVFDHLIINGGDNTYNGNPLFVGGIMNSGSVIPADTTDAPQAQAVYNAVVRGGGCQKANDTLACLRKLPYGVFLDAASSVPGLFSYRSLDLSYLPRPDPTNKFFSVSPELAIDSYAKVPVIIGDQEDEGTLFSIVTNNISTNAQLIDYLATYFPGNPNATSLVTGLVNLYPDYPNLGQPSGSPFNTGSKNNIYPQFKRVAAILGDITFTLTRRVYLDYVNNRTPVWSYLNSFDYGESFLGTFHGADISAYFPSSSGQDSFLSVLFQTYFVSFANYGDPNKLNAKSNLSNWPAYDTANPQLLHVLSNTTGLIPDTFRKNASDYLAAHTSEFRV